MIDVVSTMFTIAGTAFEKKARATGIVAMAGSSGRSVCVYGMIILPDRMICGRIQEEGRARF
jgi:hypothetical protein